MEISCRDHAYVTQFKSDHTVMVFEASQGQSYHHSVITKSEIMRIQLDVVIVHTPNCSSYILNNITPFRNSLLTPVQTMYVEEPRIFIFEANRWKDLMAFAVLQVPSGGVIIACKYNFLPKIKCDHTA